MEQKINTPAFTRFFITKICIFAKIMSLEHLYKSYSILKVKNAHIPNCIENSIHLTIGPNFSGLYLECK